MVARVARLIGLTGLLLIPTGCTTPDRFLGKTGGGSASTQPATADPPTPLVQTDLLPQPPPPPSDYHVFPTIPITRPAAAIEPVVARAQVDVKPAPPPPPPKADSPLVAALRCTLEKHPRQAREVLTKYEKNDRELLFALLRLSASIGEGELAKLDAEEVAASVERLTQLTAHLRQKASLSLENVCFCSHIDGFGAFQAVPATRPFQAGIDGRPGELVQVYAEVRNFTSKCRGDAYETILESKLEIRDAERNKVVMLDLGRKEDRSQTPRHDFFLNFQLRVPPKLPPGLYTLWVTVKDVTDGPQAGKPRQATCSLDFRVAPPGARKAP